jgi:hypothetical protein
LETRRWKSTKPAFAGYAAAVAGDFASGSGVAGFRAWVEVESAKADFVPFQPQVSNLGGPRWTWGNLG